jgi:ABC-type branched-subunit amino acid transport system permease subunit
LRRHGRYASASGWILLIAALALVPQVCSFGTLSLATTCLIFAGLVYGIDLLNGLMRYLSLAHVGLWAIAGYAFFDFQLKAGLGWFPAALLVFPVTVIAAFLIAVVAFRTTGYYFAVFTFIVMLTINLALVNLKGLTGGGSGLFVFERPQIFGLDLNSGGTFYEVCLLAMLLTIGFVLLVHRSSLGLRARAIGDSEALPQALGIDTFRKKVALFTLSAVPVALAGILYAMSLGAIQPELYGQNAAIGAVLVAVLGGSGTLLGPFLGAIVYVFAPQIVPGSPVIGEGLVGVLFFLVIRVLPAGLSSTPTAVLGLWRRRPAASQVG